MEDKGHGLWRPEKSLKSSPVIRWRSELAFPYFSLLICERLGAAPTLQSFCDPTSQGLCTVLAACACELSETGLSLSSSVEIRFSRQCILVASKAGYAWRLTWSCLKIYILKWPGLLSSNRLAHEVEVNMWFWCVGVSVDISSRGKTRVSVWQNAGCNIFLFHTFPWALSKAAYQAQEKYCSV